MLPSRMDNSFALQPRTLRGLVEKQRANLGAGLPQGDAAELDRLAARGVALVGRLLGVAGANGDALHGDVELVGGDLRHRGEHALPKLDPAGEHRDFSRRRESHPTVKIGIVVERAGRGAFIVSLPRA